MYVNFENFEISKKWCTIWGFTLFFGQKVWKSSEKSSEKVRKFRKNFGNFGKISEISETGFSECSVISVISEIWKFENIHSDSKTDPKVWLKVRNAGPLRGNSTDAVFKRMPSKTWHHLSLNKLSTVVTQNTKFEFGLPIIYNNMN